jgi:hypothetical protein
VNHWNKQKKPDKNRSELLRQPPGTGQSNQKTENGTQGAEKNTHLNILPADRGNAKIILNTMDYKLKIPSLLEDSTYKKLNKDSTDSIEWKTKQLLKKSSLPKDLRKQLQPVGSRAPRLYSLPTIHKEGVPLDPLSAPSGHLRTNWPSI